MKKTKFNRYERVAGFFILVAFLGSLLTAASVAIKQGWFEKKTHYMTLFIGAEGVHPGTEVQISGLKAGTVEGVELERDNRIRLTFSIQGKLSERIKKDSVAQLIRPFVIGDRILDISVGSDESPHLPEDSEILSQEAVDLISLMGGKQLGASLARFGDMVNNVQKLAAAFLNENRTQSMVKIFDRLDPLIVNLDLMSREVVKLSRQVTKEEGLYKLVHETTQLSEELNRIVPEMNRAFKAVGPELPSTARRAMEALNEATILMKALQKNFMLRGNVKEVLEEESQRKRLPSGSP